MNNIYDSEFSNVTYINKDNIVFIQIAVFNLIDYFKASVRNDGCFLRIPLCIWGDVLYATAGNKRL